MDYLYFLQILREKAPDFVSWIFFGISESAVSILLALPAILYWSVNKQFGSFVLMSSVGANYCTQFVKNCACVYRPWIKDSRLYVDPMVEKSATGYSFPSGHTTQAASVYESTAVWSKKRWIIILCTVLTFLTAFSRNWFGAHTIKDVLVAILIAMVMIIVNIFITRWLSIHPENDWAFALICVMLAGAGLIFLITKKYPVEYTLEGELLVDPYKMLTDCFGSFGIILGFFSGWIVERHFVKFDEKGTVKRRVLRSVFGVLGAIFLYVVILHFACYAMDDHLRKFVKMAVMYFYVAGGYPAIVKLFQKK